jgi:hypothetical protein
MRRGAEFMSSWWGGAHDRFVLSVLADIFPGGGGPLADLFSIAIAVGLFALLYWAIDLIDRV